jgi:hypothetical protein
MNLGVIFRQPRLRLAIRETDAEVFASLVSLPDGQLVAPMYGRGVDENSAALRAMERWQQEQDG